MSVDLSSVAAMSQTSEVTPLSLESALVFLGVVDLDLQHGEDALIY